MNKTAIKNFAIWARVQLIESAKQRAYEYEITETGNNKANVDSIGGRLLSVEEKEQRKQLISQIQRKGYTQVMEEAAYTWFNRFIALRYMEVNGFLPSKVRVFTDENGAFKPEIMKEAMAVEIDGLDRAVILDLLDKQNNEELYKYLLITQCNALNQGLPYMFEKISNWTELLFPANLLRPDSVVGQMVSEIPEEDWQDAVQIIGWMYQYYNSELKDDTFAQLKKNVKITKERIPAATQLFTPDWIVRYMVENSLGRLWLEGHPNAELHDGWKYYLDEADQEPEVEAQLAKLREEYKTIKPEEIKVIDPCMGSGHILVYAFDVLMQIYTSAGWDQREAAQSILKNNLYGLDIDDRAAQLAYFAVMMKARQYDRRLLTRGIQPHIYAFAESNTITTAPLHDMGITLSQDEYDTAVKQVLRLLDELRDAKEYGSILTVTPCDWDLLRRFAVPRTEDEGGQQLLGIHGEQIAAPLLQRLINIGEALSQQYDVVVTNPPYMGASGMNARLSQYIKDHFPDTKADLFACFIERGNQMAVKHGYNCMVTMQSWMFLSSFEKMREKILRTKSITNLMHMENMVMGIAFGTAVTIFRNDHITGYKGTYNQIKLQDIENGEPKTFPVPENRFAQTSTDNFSKIPGYPVAYWVSKGLLSAFATGKSLGDIALARNGMKTGENGRFVRLWWEVIFQGFNPTACDWKEASSSGAKWFPYNKGGEFRKWYGNNDCVVNWQNEGDEIFNHAKADKRNVQDYPLELKFKPSASWSLVTSGQPAFRYKENNLSDIAGMSFFTEKQELLILLGFCNSKIALEILRILAPTINFQAGDIGRLPIVDYGVVTETIRGLVSSNIDESTTDWDSSEVSWDFKRHPLV